MILTLIGGLIILIAIILIFLKKESIKKVVLPAYFIIFLISTISLIYTNLRSGNLFLETIGSFWTYFAFAIVLLHSSLTLGNKKTTILFIISLLFGLVSELVGVKFGWVFGSYYYTLSPFFFGLVPLLTPVSWAIIIYISYTLSNIILNGFGSEKPNLKNNGFLSVVLLIIFLSSIDGLIATNLDMIIDPVSVYPSVAGWVWIGGGSYFGIPISNFIGWFLVTFSATFIFRFYESLKKDTIVFKQNKYMPLYVIFLYLIYLLINTSMALRIGKSEYILIGVATMAPFILITSLVCLLNYLKSDNNDE